MAATPTANRPLPTTSEVDRADLLRMWPKVTGGMIGTTTVLVLVYLWGVAGTNASPGTLIGGLPNIWDFVTRMFPPAFDTQQEVLKTPAIDLVFFTIPRVGVESVTFAMPTILFAIIETVQMAIIGSSLAIVISIPFALLAARNITPHPVAYQVTRMLLNWNRAIPDIIFALIFVAAVGLGPFGGVLALGIGSIGTMGKIYAEAIEAIDPQQVKAIQATGANRVQTIFYAVFPQAMPMVTSYSLLIFESNVRSATILGLVGAGGVGFTITKYMSLFQYDKLLGALIFIVLMVTIVDRVSAWLRGKLI
jgi:phosphonate transport system permease protein